MQGELVFSICQDTEGVVTLRALLPEGNALGERKWEAPGGLFFLRPLVLFRRLFPLVLQQVNHCLEAEGTNTVRGVLLDLGGGGVEGVEERAGQRNSNNSQQGAPRPVRRSSNGGRRELWCLVHAMTVAAAVALWHRAHLYKAIACVVLALIAIQYLLSGVIDRRSIETIFTINATRYVRQTFPMIIRPRKLTQIFTEMHRNGLIDNSVYSLHIHCTQTHESTRTIVFRC